MNEEIRFDDYPEFRPTLTPRQIFAAGAFGGTYWRPIDSGVTGRHYEGEHLKYNWDLPERMLSSPVCDPSVNKYGVTSGQSLAEWERKGWIKAQDPYGWVQWYCEFYLGRRTEDDERQIDRWKGVAGPNGRFKKRLLNMIKKANTHRDDYTISPVIRQLLLQWGVD